MEPDYGPIQPQAEHHAENEENIQSVPQPPGRPLCIVRVDRVHKGDHIIYLINDNEEYRPVYQSALVTNASDVNDSITVILYTTQGVKQRDLVLSPLKSLHKVNYANGFTADMAVTNARKRLNENHYCALKNNSHFFVTKAKTGFEYSLADIIHAIQEPSSNDHLKPVPMKSLIQSINDIKPADHIMDCANHHWLVESIDVDNRTFSGFTINENSIVCEPTVPWKILYKITNYFKAETESVESVLERARNELEGEKKWDGSDRFVTSMKCGSPFYINEFSLIDSNCAPVSCTRVTPHIMVDQGEHLMVKTDRGYCSVLVERVINANAVVCIPGLEGNRTHDDLTIANKEVYRVNYSQHLPSDEVLLRANSSEGKELLHQYQHDTSLYVSWAVTGGSFPVVADELINNQQLKLVTPMSYKCINNDNLHEVQPGDHLFVHYSYRWRWHFMVTEICEKPKVFNTVYCYRGQVKETKETIDPDKLHVYKVIYTEEFASEIAIERARSKVGNRNTSMWARTEFVPWAKTGSDDGIEVDYMTNCSVPSSKSSIACFGQISPGDYLVVETVKMVPFHHYLVTNVASPEHCTVIEVWNHKVRQPKSDLELNDKHKYYRMNYSSIDGICTAADKVITLARQKLSTRQWRQTFVNCVKTGDKLHTVNVNSLQDDRLLFPRERIESALQLKPGDHIERPLKHIGNITKYCHHMLVIKPVDDRKCLVIHCNKEGIKATKEEEIPDIFKDGPVSRVKYTERIDPEEGINNLRKLINGDSEDAHQASQSQTGQVYSWKDNNCEHVVMLGTIGKPISIQVSVDVRQSLHNVHRDITAITPEFGDACMRATSKGAIKTVAKVASTVIIRGVAKTAVRSGTSAVTQGVTDAAESTLNAAMASSFRIGYTAALSATTVGLVGGIALGANVLVEAPLFVRGIYKTNRKEKFNIISKTEAKREYAIKTITSVSTVVGGVGGAVVGQCVIPVPVLGATIGGFTGVMLGKACGYGEGKLAALLIKDKMSDLPMIIHCVYVPISSTTDPETKAPDTTGPETALIPQ